jgi:hypothetical protein
MHCVAYADAARVQPEITMLHAARDWYACSETACHLECCMPVACRTRHAKGHANLRAAMACGMPNACRFFCPGGQCRRAQACRLRHATGNDGTCHAMSQQGHACLCLSHGPNFDGTCTDMHVPNGTCMGHACPMMGHANACPRHVPGMSHLGHACPCMSHQNLGHGTCTNMHVPDMTWRCISHRYPMHVSNGKPDGNYTAQTLEKPNFRILCTCCTC